MNQNWVMELILAWLWHHFHLAFESNPRPSDRELSALPLDHSFRLIKLIFNNKETYFKSTVQFVHLKRWHWKMNENVAYQSVTREKHHDGDLPKKEKKKINISFRVKIFFLNSRNTFFRIYFFFQCNADTMWWLALKWPNISLRGKSIQRTPCTYWPSQVQVRTVITKQRIPFDWTIL